MILNFAINNYKSINELMNIELELDASIKTNNHHNLIIEKNNIKSSRLNFLYGNNGSGKSNIINGIKVLKMIALNELEKINDEQLIIPFKLSTKTNDDIFFHLDFISNNNRYNYNVYYDSKKQELRDEELVLVNGEVETIIFDRQIKNYNKLKDKESRYDIKKISLLSILNNSKQFESNEEVKYHSTNVFKFFQNIHFGFSDIRNSQELDELPKDNTFLNKLSEKISKYDLTVTRLRLNEEKAQYGNNKNTIEIYHGDKFLNSSEESPGTMKAISAIYSLLAKNNGVWFVDDFESYLHTKNTLELVKFLTKNFLDSQFVFITHELELLDLEEVKFKPLHYLVERDEKTYNTSITRMSDYKDLRSDNRHNWRAFYEFNRLGKYPSPKLFED